MEDVNHTKNISDQKSVESDSHKQSLEEESNHESDMSCSSESSSIVASVEENNNPKLDMLNLTATRHSWHADETLTGDCNEIDQHVSQPSSAAVVDV